MAIVVDMKNRKLIVVLGMHRSGTSALTRGLQSLNVDLGERLILGIPDNNAKGFWEDADLNMLNNELLHFLGHSWDSLAPISRSELESENLLTFKQRAVALLSEKLEGQTTYGIKDPRIARLLPFWRAVFEQLDLEVGYVIAVRHPLSVANSLGKRDDFELEKSLYLWLGHIIPIILELEYSPRIVVDYDILIARPQEQLFRMASALDLPFNESSPDVNEYSNEFLTDDLRHTQFHLDDLKLASNIPRDLVEAYELLSKLALDELPIDSPNVHKVFIELSQRMTEMRPAFIYMTKLENQIATLNDAVGERNAQIGALTQALELKNTDIDNKTVSFNDAVKDRDAQIGTLTQALELKNADIDNYIQQIQNQQHQLDTLLSSVSWRLTTPLRYAATMIRKKTGI